MPDYMRDTPHADWINCRSWPEVWEEFGKRREQEEDCAGYSVRTSKNEADEARADEHPKTRDLFTPPAETSGPPIAHRAASAGRAADPAGIDGESAPSDASAQDGEERSPLLQKFDQIRFQVDIDEEDYQRFKDRVSRIEVPSGLVLQADGEPGHVDIEWTFYRGRYLALLGDVAYNVLLWELAREPVIPCCKYPLQEPLNVQLGLTQENTRWHEDELPEDAARNEEGVEWVDVEAAPRQSHAGRPSPLGRTAPPDAREPAPSNPTLWRSRDRTPSFTSAPRDGVRAVVEGLSEFFALLCMIVIEHWGLAMLGLVALFGFGGYALFSGDDGPASQSIATVEVAEEAAARSAATGGADIRRPDVSTPPVEESTARATEDSVDLVRSDRRRIQAGLSAVGHDPGPPDGLFGAGTRTAIRNWQAARGAPATGYLHAVEAEELIALGGGESEDIRADAPRPTAVGGVGNEGTRANAPRPAAVVEAGTGSLAVRAEPSSRIELDGVDVGGTGSSGILVLSGIRPGRHVVVARKQGYTAATNVVEVVDGRSEVVELTLDALPGTLTVTANVPGAILSIEGAGDHRLPVTRLEVSAGSRRVTVMGEGYEPVDENVEIRAGELTTLDVVLEPVRVGELVRVVRSRFDAGNYQGTVEGARAVLNIRPDAGAAHLLLGRALYQLGRFDESTVPLYRAILLGEQVVLPTNHRHGGGGFRQGFCRGVISLSTSEIAFRSRDEPDHGFTVSPDKVTDVEVADAVRGQAFRLNIQVQDQGTRRRGFDFVHRDTRRQRQDPDSPLFVLLTCPDCDGSMGVQAGLMARLFRLGM